MEFQAINWNVTGILCLGAAMFTVGGAGLWLLLRALIGSMNTEAVTTVLRLVIVVPVVTAGGVFAFVRELAG